MEFIKIMLISIVINCYNQAQFLPDAIHSLIGGQTSLGKMRGQTYKNFEIIVVNDGSIDDTKNVAKRFNVKYIEQSNQGAAVAMNTGIDAAKGDLICPLDADDMFKSTRLQTMFDVQIQNLHSFVYDDLIYFCDDHFGWQGKLKLVCPEYDFDRVLQKNGIHKGLMYPKQAWIDNGGYPENFNKGREDWAFNVALGLNGYCGIHTGQADYLYRKHTNNRTNINNTTDWNRYFINQMKQQYKDIYEGYRPMACCGKRRKTQKVAGKIQPKTFELPGQDGMVIVNYVGNSQEENMYIGSVTGTHYVFGDKIKRGYVDIKDKDNLLNIIQN